MGVGALSLAGLLKLKGHAGTEASSLRGKSVVLLFLHGGPPHIEFFDPKMTAPSEIHSVTGEVATTIPGIAFGGTFPRLASMADRLAIIRSYGSQNTAHRYDGVVSGGASCERAGVDSGGMGRARTVRKAERLGERAICNGQCPLHLCAGPGLGAHRYYREN